MFGIGGSSTGRSRAGSEYSTKSDRKRDEDETPTKRRSRTGSTTSSSSKRKSSHKDSIEQDGGFNPSSTSFSSSSRSPYAGVAAPSIASSYATAYNTGLEGGSQPPALVRNESMRDDVERGERKSSRRESKSSSKSERRRTLDEDEEDRRSSTRPDNDKSRRRSSRKSSSKTEQNESTRAVSEHDAALPQNQFFSDPSTYTAPYRPPGLAAEYYGDQGESVHYQPGVRPNAPSYVVNAEQAHLQTPSMNAKPPQEPSAAGQLGAAASFYSMHSSGDETAHQSTAGKPGRPSRQASETNEVATSRTSPLPNGRVSQTHAPNSFGVATMGSGLGEAASYYANSETTAAAQQTASSGYTQRTHSQQSQYQNTGYSNAESSQEPQQSTSGHGYGTAAAMGIAGAAAGAYYASHHPQGHDDSRVSGPDPGFRIGNNESAFPTMQQRQRHRHRGPMAKFVDWFRDPAGVAEFEEWSEYVGVCKYCFDPQSSPADAPRKHHHHQLRRKASSGGRKGSVLRVDKTYRHSSSDEDRKKRSSTIKKVATAGITGLGAAAVGEALYKSKHDFDDTYSVQSGRPYNASERNQHVSRQSMYPSNDDARLDRKRSSRKDRRETGIYRESRKGRRRDSSSSDKGLSRGATMSVGAGAAGLAIAADAVHRRKSRSRSRSPSKKKYYSKRVSPRHSYVDLTSTQQGSPGFGSFFSSPSANKSKGKRPKGIFNFSNASNSSSDADLAFGEGTVRRKNDRKLKDDRQSRRKENNGIGDTAAILGLAATGAALAAESDRRKEKGKEKRDANDPSGSSSRQNQTKIDLQDHETTSDAENDDIWEDASEDESVNSVEAGLAYGGRHSATQSRESLVSEEGTSKWAWRWDKNKDKREEKARQRRAPFDRKDSASYDKFSSAALGAGLGVAAAALSHEPSPTTVPPLRHIDPFPTSESTPTPNSHPVSSQKFASASPIDLEQPQPVSPIAVAARFDSYEATEPLTESPTEIVEPRERRSRADFENRQLSSLQERDPSPSRTGPFNASTLSKSSVTFNLTDEQLENERRAMEKEERRRSKRDRQAWRMSADAASLQQQIGAENLGRRRSASLETKSARELEIEAELENLYKEHRRQQSEKRKLAEERQRKTAEEIRQGQRDEPEDVISRTDKTRQHSTTSDVAKVAIAAAAGAGIVGAVLNEREKSKSSAEETAISKHRSGSKDNGNAQSIAYSEESQQERIARMAAQRIKSSSPVHEDYSKFFTPEDIAEHVKEHNAAAEHRDDLDANIIEAVPGEALSSERRVPHFDPENYRPFGLDPDDDPLRFPWRVPLLGLIEPTPPHSMTHSPRAPASPMSSTKDPEDDVKTAEDIGEPLERKQSTGSRVTWGDHDTYVYEVQTPDDERNDPHADMYNDRHVNQTMNDQHRESRVDPTLENEEDVDQPEEFYRSKTTLVDPEDRDIQVTAPVDQSNEDRKPRERSISPPRPFTSGGGTKTTSQESSFVTNEDQMSSSGFSNNDSGPRSSNTEQISRDYQVTTNVPDRMPGSFDSDDQAEATSVADKNVMTAMRQAAQAAALAAMRKQRSSETRAQIDDSPATPQGVVQDNEHENTGTDSNEHKSRAAKPEFSGMSESNADLESRKELDSISNDSRSNGKDKKKSRRRSRRDSDYLQGSQDVNASANTSTEQDMGTKTRQRSKRDSEVYGGEDFDEARLSDANENDRELRRHSEPDAEVHDDSGPPSRNGSTKSERKRKKSGGMFSGLFSAGKPDANETETSRSKSEGRRKSSGSKKRSSRSSAENLISDSSERHNEDNPISTDVAFPEGEKDQSYVDGESFLEKRPEMPQPMVSTDMPMGTDGVSGLHNQSKPSIGHQDRTEETALSGPTGIDVDDIQPVEQSDSHGGGGVEKQLPESGSETASRRHSRALSTLQTSDFASSPISISSPTAVPLHFRRPPLTPRGQREVESSPIMTPISPLATPRTRQSRPKSTEFFSKEVRPLYLVERINQAKVPSPHEEETYPSLPSSRATSANPSIEDLRGLAAHGNQVNPDEFVQDGNIDRGQRHSWQDANERKGSPDYLDSRSTTPVPGDNQRIRDLRERKELPKYLFHSPSELLQDPSENHELYQEDIEARSGSPLPSVVSTDLDQDFMSAESGTSSPLEDRHPRSHSAPIIDPRRSAEPIERSTSTSKLRSSSVIAATGLGLLTGATLEMMSSHTADDKSQPSNRNLHFDDEPTTAVPISELEERASRYDSVAYPSHALQDDQPAARIEEDEAEAGSDAHSALNREILEPRVADPDRTRDESFGSSDAPYFVATSGEGMLSVEDQAPAPENRDLAVDAGIKETSEHESEAAIVPENLSANAEKDLDPNSHVGLTQTAATDEVVDSRPQNHEEQEKQPVLSSSKEADGWVSKGTQDQTERDIDLGNAISVEEVENSENASNIGLPILEPSEIESPYETVAVSPRAIPEDTLYFPSADSPSDQHEMYSDPPEHLADLRNLPRLQTTQSFVPSIEQIDAAYNDLGAFELAFERAVRSRGLCPDITREQAMEPFLPKRNNAPFIPKGDLTPIGEQSTNNSPASQSAPMTPAETIHEHLRGLSNKKNKKAKRKEKKAKRGSKLREGFSSEEEWPTSDSARTTPARTPSEDRLQDATTAMEISGLEKGPDYNPFGNDFVIRETESTASPEAQTSTPDIMHDNITAREIGVEGGESALHFDQNRKSMWSGEVDQRDGEEVFSDFPVSEKVADSRHDIKDEVSGHSAEITEEVSQTDVAGLGKTVNEEDPISDAHTNADTLQAGTATADRIEEILATDKAESPVSEPQITTDLAENKKEVQDDIQETTLEPADIQNEEEFTWSTGKSKKGKKGKKTKNKKTLDLNEDTVAPALVADGLAATNPAFFDDEKTDNSAVAPEEVAAAEPMKVVEAADIEERISASNTFEDSTARSAIGQEQLQGPGKTDDDIAHKAEQRIPWDFGLSKKEKKKKEKELRRAETWDDRITQEQLDAELLDSRETNKDQTEANDTPENVHATTPAASAPNDEPELGKSSDVEAWDVAPKTIKKSKKQKRKSVVDDWIKDSPTAEQNLNKETTEDVATKSAASLPTSEMHKDSSDIEATLVSQPRTHTESVVLDTFDTGPAQLPDAVSHTEPENQAAESTHRSLDGISLNDGITTAPVTDEFEAVDAEEWIAPKKSKKGKKPKRESVAETSEQIFALDAHSGGQQETIKEDIAYNVDEYSQDQQGNTIALDPAADDGVDATNLPPTESIPGESDPHILSESPNRDLTDPVEEAIAAEPEAEFSWSAPKKMSKKDKKKRKSSSIKPDASIEDSANFQDLTPSENDAGKAAEVAATTDEGQDIQEEIGDDTLRMRDEESLRGAGEEEWVEPIKKSKKDKKKRKSALRAFDEQETVIGEEKVLPPPAKETVPDETEPLQEEVIGRENLTSSTPPRKLSKKERRKSKKNSMFEMADFAEPSVTEDDRAAEEGAGGTTSTERLDFQEAENNVLDEHSKILETEADAVTPINGNEFEALNSTRESHPEADAILDKSPGSPKPMTDVTQPEGVADTIDRAEVTGAKFTERGNVSTTPRLEVDDPFADPILATPILEKTHDPFEDVAVDNEVPKDMPSSEVVPVDEQLYSEDTTTRTQTDIAGPGHDNTEDPENFYRNLSAVNEARPGNLPAESEEQMLSERKASRERDQKEEVVTEDLNPDAESTFQDETKLAKKNKKDKKKKRFSRLDVSDLAEARNAEDVQAQQLPIAAETAATEDTSITMEDPEWTSSSKKKKEKKKKRASHSIISEETIGADTPEEPLKDIEDGQAASRDSTAELAAEERDKAELGHEEFEEPVTTLESAGESYMLPERQELSEAPKEVIDEPEDFYRNTSHTEIPPLRHTEEAQASSDGVKHDILSEGVSSQHIGEHPPLDEQQVYASREMEDSMQEQTSPRSPRAGPRDLAAAGIALGAMALATPDVIDKVGKQSDEDMETLDDHDRSNEDALRSSDADPAPSTRWLKSRSLPQGSLAHESEENFAVERNADQKSVPETFEKPAASDPSHLSAPHMRDSQTEAFEDGALITEESRRSDEYDELTPDRTLHEQPTEADINSGSKDEVHEGIVDEPAVAEDEAWAFVPKKSKKDKKKKRASKAEADGSDKQSSMITSVDSRKGTEDGESSMRLDNLIEVPSEIPIKSEHNADFNVEPTENEPEVFISSKKSKKDKKKKRASLFEESIEAPSENPMEISTMQPAARELPQATDTQVDSEQQGDHPKSESIFHAPTLVQSKEEFEFGTKKSKKDKKKKKRQSIPGAFDSEAGTPAAETPATITQPSSPQMNPLSKSLDHDMVVEELRHDQEATRGEAVAQEAEDDWSFPTKKSKKDKKKKKRLALEEQDEDRPDDQTLKAMMEELDGNKLQQEEEDLREPMEDVEQITLGPRDELPWESNDLATAEVVAEPSTDFDPAPTRELDDLVDPIDMEPTAVEQSTRDADGAAIDDTDQGGYNDVYSEARAASIDRPSINIAATSAFPGLHVDNLEDQVSEIPQVDMVRADEDDRRSRKKEKKKKKARNSLPLDRNYSENKDQIAADEGFPRVENAEPTDEPELNYSSAENHPRGFQSLEANDPGESGFDANQESDTGSNVSEATRERRRRRKSPPVWSGEEPDDLPRSPRNRALTPPPDHDDIMDTALGVAAGLGFGASDQGQPVVDPTKRRATTRDGQSWSFSDTLQADPSTRDSGIQFEESPHIHQTGFNTTTRDSGYAPSPVLADSPQEHSRELPENHRSSLRPPRPRSPTSSAEDISISRHARDHPEATRSAFETPSRRQPSPIESTSKDRDSGLFKSSPAIPTPSGAHIFAEHLSTPTSDLRRTPSIHGHQHQGRGDPEADNHSPQHRRASDELSSSLLNRAAVANIDRDLFSPSPRQSSERVTSPTRRSLHTIDEDAMVVGTLAAAGLGGAAMLSREDSRSHAKSLGQSDSQSSSHHDLGQSTASPIDASGQRGIQEQPSDAHSVDRDASMADVFDGYGAAPGSPRSPTRPPSLRKRQSLQQIVDLQARVEQLASENRQLAEQKILAERHIEDLHLEHSKTDYATQEALETVNAQLRERDEQITSLRTEIETLISTRDAIKDEHEQKYTLLLNEKDNAHAQWQESSRELGNLRDQHQELSVGMEGIVRSQIDAAVADKDAEIQKLRNDLDAAREKIRELQAQILSMGSDEVITVRDEDYFDSACQQLCQHVQQWVLRFSKFSDTRVCRSTHQVRDDKIVDRFDNAILDGSDVDAYLADRVKRRDVFMSVVMAMIWEFVFTRYLFGMDRDQRQKLKQLEKNLAEIGPTGAIHQWRALTLTLLSKRAAFKTQKESDLEAVAGEVFQTLSKFLPPPSNVEAQSFESLRNVMRAAVNLSIEMRTQKAEYIMLPPLQPEYDTNGDLARKVYFNAGLMNERSGDFTSNDELERDHAVVRMVLFPLVVKKGDDSGAGEEEFVVCPAQVLVAKQDKGKRPKSRIASGESQSNRAQSRMSGLEAASTHSLGAMSGVVTGEGNMI